MNHSYYHDQFSKAEIIFLNINDVSAVHEKFLNTYPEIEVDVSLVPKTVALET